MHREKHMNTTSNRFPVLGRNRLIDDEADLPKDLEDPELEVQEDETWEGNEIDQQQERKVQRGWRILTLLGFLLTAITCLALGALWARHRYAAQKVVASINGHIITQDAFVHRLEVASGSDVLQRMANETLQDQYAKKLGIIITQSEIDARFKQVSSKPDFPRYLATTHQSVEDVLNQLRIELIANKIITREVKVSESDVALYYRAETNKNNPQARFYTPPRVTIAVITARNKERLRKAQQELEKGANFATVATTYSEDRASKNNGGELPPITRGRTFNGKVPGLETILFSMNVGETTGPVSIGPMWSLIRCLKQEPEVIQPREQVDYECRMGAMMVRLPKSTAAKIHADYLQFQQNANMHAFRPEYIKVFGGR
jgi:parvulin-like peptidyl-prolyl isomerase